MARVLKVDLFGILYAIKQVDPEILSVLGAYMSEYGRGQLEKFMGKEVQVLGYIQNLRQLESPMRCCLSPVLILNDTTVLKEDHVWIPVAREISLTIRNYLRSVLHSTRRYNHLALHGHGIVGPYLKDYDIRQYGIQQLRKLSLSFDNGQTWDSFGKKTISYPGFESRIRDRKAELLDEAKTNTENYQMQLDAKLLDQLCDLEPRVFKEKAVRQAFDRVRRGVSLTHGQRRVILEIMASFKKQEVL